MTNLGKKSRKEEKEGGRQARKKEERKKIMPKGFLYILPPKPKPFTICHLQKVASA